jgi:hypothetical protein
MSYPNCGSKKLWVGVLQITKVTSYLNCGGGTKKKKKKRVFADLDTKDVFFKKPKYRVGSFLFLIIKMSL